jgi:hypothetical protein
MSKLFKIVIDTEQYAGNFEREMCAYITGQTGECSVGDDWARLYASTIKYIDWWEEHIAQRPDDSDSPCYRPVAIYPTGGWYNNGYGGHFKDTGEAVKIKCPAYMSVAIFTNKHPPEAVLLEFTERAREFCANRIELSKPLSRMNVRKNIDFTGIRIVSGIRKEVLVSEIKFN